LPNFKKQSIIKANQKISKFAQPDYRLAILTRQSPKAINWAKKSQLKPE
jgi:hypothetical protein